MSTPTYVDRSSNASISDALTDLALDMRWSFNHAADRLWEQLRPNLLLHDPARLLNILMNREHPVQLVLAGKAHPQDVEGQNMIKQWIEFAQHPEARSRWSFSPTTTCSWRSTSFRVSTSGLTLPGAPGKRAVQAG